MAALHEDAILKLAIKRGLLSDADLHDLTLLAIDQTLETGRWGARIQHLVASGRLTEEAVESLAKEANHAADPFGERTSYVEPQTAARATWPEEGPRSGQEWDRYRLVRLLGAGGMGRVFQAYDPRLHRHVALKFILGNDPDRTQRFLREAQAQARVDHEHVCRIYEVHQVQDRPYISMQFINGSTLGQAQQEMTLREKVMAMRDVAEGIHAAHRLGLIHRDIKPGNILVEKRENGWHPYVMDFGLARPLVAPDLTQAGLVLGTPSFMSPEQASGNRNLDRRSDIYSLGATLYAIVSGRPPFEGSSPMEVLSSIANNEPATLRHGDEDIPRELETIIFKCLEKDPAYRYDSARALADDLQRFLDGEPIQARPASLAYRIGKKMRKSPIASAIAAGALLCAIALGVVALHSRWTAAERAQTERKFGQDVERIQAVMRYAYMLPLHDITPEKMIVRRRMQKITEDIKELGAGARGPGAYALGRGHLALGEHAEAKGQLEEALRAGYHSPELSYALGLTLGTLYEEKLERAEKNLDLQLRRQEIHRIETELRDPALRYLGEARKSETESAHFLEATTAYYQKDYDRAIREAQQAIAEVPWFYEAIRLQGDVHHEMARKERDSGNFDRAREEFRKADDAFRHASAMAQSDPQNYDRNAAMWRTFMMMELYYSGGNVDEPFAKLVESAEQSQVADPHHSLPLIRKSQACALLAEYRTDHGGDTLTLVKQAFESAERAIAMDPKNPESYTSRAWAYHQVGYEQSLKSDDPRPALQKAIDDYSKAIQLDPQDGIYNDMGTTQRIAAEYEMGHGLNPLSHLERSIDAFHMALKLNPRNDISYNNLAISYDTQGMYQLERGEDPTAALNLAVENYQRASELSPGSPFSISNQGSSYVHMSEYDQRSGHDPLPHLNKAMECFRKAISINPNHANFYSNLTEACISAASYGIHSGQDPARWLSDGESAIEKAIQINKADYYYPLLKAQLQVLRVRFDFRSGSSPLTHLSAARELMAQVKKLNADDPDVEMVSAETTLLEAQWNRKNGRAIQMSDGLAAIDRGLKIRPDHARSMAIKGALLLLQGDAHGADLIARAVKIDPSLKWDFESQ